MLDKLAICVLSLTLGSLCTLAAGVASGHIESDFTMPAITYRVAPKAPIAMLADTGPFTIDSAIAAGILQAVGIARPASAQQPISDPYATLAGYGAAKPAPIPHYMRDRMPAPRGGLPYSPAKHGTGPLTHAGLHYAGTNAAGATVLTTRPAL